MLQNRPKYIKTEEVNIPMDDQMMAQMKLLQAISPEVDENHDKYIPGTKAGMLVITRSPAKLVSGKDGLTVVPLLVRKQYIEYVPRKKGGGFVAAYDSKEEMEAKYTDGNDITPSIQILCMEFDPTTSKLDEEAGPFWLRLEGASKMAVARKVASIFAEHGTVNGIVLKVTSVQARNKQDQSYYNYKIEPAAWTPKEALLVAQSVTASSTHLLPAGTDPELT